MIEISSSFESSKHVPVSFWFAAVLHKGHPKAQQIALSFLLPVGPISAGQLEPRPRQFHHWQHQWLVWNLLRLRSSCLRSELQCASQIFLISCVFLFSAQPLKHSDAFGQPSKWIWIMQQTSLHDFILKEMKHTLHQQDFHPFSQSLPGNPLASLYHIAVQKDVGFREYGSPGSNHNGRMCSFMCLSSICTCPIPRLPRACTSCLQVRREPSCPTCIRWHDLATTKEGTQCRWKWLNSALWVVGVKRTVRHCGWSRIRPVLPQLTVDMWLATQESTKICNSPDHFKSTETIEVPQRIEQ